MFRTATSRSLWPWRAFSMALYVALFPSVAWAKQSLSDAQVALFFGLIFGGPCVLLMSVFCLISGRALKRPFARWHRVFGWFSLCLSGVVTVGFSGFLWWGVWSGQLQDAVGNVMLVTFPLLVTGGISLWLGWRMAWRKDEWVEA